MINENAASLMFPIRAVPDVSFCATLQLLSAPFYKICLSLRIASVHTAQASEQDKVAQKAGRSNQKISDKLYSSGLACARGVWQCTSGGLCLHHISL